jgi:hypothetical protein
MKARKKGSGGKRKGAGRKSEYSTPLTETISIRVALKHKEAIKQHIKDFSHKYHLKHS